MSIELESTTATAVESAAQMPPGDLGATAVKMFLSLIVLVALLFISYWFLRRLIQNRLQKGGGEQAIQILEKRMISPKTMLYIIEVENKKILVAESQLEVKRLGELP
ncbi:MAG TPA: flagellar biosynthetic protein FliO [Chlamydiales bacterium]|nr:flagellar biosynthetic protein FliO [Chlamydiales bacterium]